MRGFDFKAGSGLIRRPASTPQAGEAVCLPPTGGWPREPAIHSPYAPGWRTPTIAGILLAVPIPTEERPMLNAAIDFWLLPATLFFDAFLPASKPVAEIIPLTSAAVQRARRRRKRLATGRLKLDRIFAVNRLL
jgi:hypothetical protein